MSFMPALIMPAASAAKTATPFEMFYALSQWATGRQVLDDTVARAIFRLLEDEPWSGKHITTAFALLDASADPYGFETILAAEESWFMRHLATIWYTGIYDHAASTTRVVTYDKALMWDALDGIRPPLVHASNTWWMAPRP